MTENLISHNSELIDHLLKLHEGEKYYKTIILLLAEGYSRLKISTIIGKSRTVVDKRVQKIANEILDYKRMVEYVW